jgi:hypothetical protein
MLFVLGFDRIGVAACDLYFVDPNPKPGQEGAERGVRLEVRLLERGPVLGSVYSAQPLVVDRPIWRADLLEAVANPGTLDRAHHHPRFRGWEPGPRHFAPDMSADPVAWVGARLSDLPGLLHEVGAPPDAISAGDVEEVRAAVPDILAAVGRLLERARTLESSEAPSPEEGLRIGWL